MAKFGVFNINGGNTPLKEVEGDFMQQDREFVKIINRKPGANPDEQVAAFHLDKGQLVKKLSD